MHSLSRELINVLLVAFIGVAILLIFLFRQPYHRGFFCNDPSIRHPLKPSTISNSLLLNLSHVNSVVLRASSPRVPSSFPTGFRILCKVGGGGVGGGGVGGLFKQRGHWGALGGLLWLDWATVGEGSFVVRESLWVLASLYVFGVAFFSAVDWVHE